MSANFLRRLNPGAASNSGPSHSPLALILPAVDRLRQALSDENDDIARRGPVDYHGYNLRKSQGLLELKRLAPAIVGAAIGADLHEALIDLQSKLETNQHMLSTQLKAAQAVADIIARAIRESQSDGTYSARAWLDERE
jgi:hypothetical protein